LPYNAHTTTSDALWAGLPVLTCAGRSFAGRVAASLLHAIALPELVTYNLEDYEAMALKLATQPDLLRQIREKLAQNRSSSTLFDCDRFRRHLEAAYIEMRSLWLCGEKPKAFAIAPENEEGRVMVESRC
jgi:protein O-GlcNAc transferase